MPNRKPRTIITRTLFVLVMVLPCYGQPGAGAITAVVAGKVGSDLITEARQTARTLIQQGENSGNALLKAPDPTPRTRKMRIAE